LIEVELGDLEKVGKEISNLLEKKLGAEVVLKGSRLIVSDKKDGSRFGVKDVKIQLKRVLYHLGLSDKYRVLAEHGKIRIVREKEKPRQAPERRGVAPPPSQSLPYLFP